MNLEESDWGQALRRARIRSLKLIFPMLSEAFRAVGTSTSHGSSPCSRRSTTTAISSSSTTLWAPESRKRLRVWSTSSPCPDFRCLRSCRPLTGDEAANQVKHFADVIHGEAEPICSGTDSKQCRWSTPSWSPPHWPARQHRELSQAAGEVKLIAGIHSPVHRDTNSPCAMSRPARSACNLDRTVVFAYLMRGWTA